MAEGKLHLKQKTGKWNFASVPLPRPQQPRCPFSEPTARDPLHRGGLRASPRLPRLPKCPGSPGKVPADLRVWLLQVHRRRPSSSSPRRPGHAPHGPCSCRRQAALRAPLRPASPQIARTPGPAQGPRQPCPSRGAPGVAAHQAGPPCREGSAEEPAPSPSMTAAPREAGWGWAPPGGGSDRGGRSHSLPCSGPGDRSLLLPSRAGPSPSRAERRRTEPKLSRSRAEPSGTEGEPSGAEPLAQANKMAAVVLPARERAVQTAGCLRSNSPPPAPAPPLRVRAAPGGGAEPRGWRTAAEWQRRAAPRGAGPRRGAGQLRVRGSHGGRPGCEDAPPSFGSNGALRSPLGRFKTGETIVLCLHSLFPWGLSDLWSSLLLSGRCRCFVLWGSLLSWGTTAGTTRFPCLDHFGFDCI